MKIVCVTSVNIGKLCCQFSYVVNFILLIPTIHLDPSILFLGIL